MESWIDSYFESLTKADIETGQREALALKRENFPKALYRFRSLERLAYILDELRKGYVYLSDPANFNDPYDSALSTSPLLFFSQALEPYGYGDPSTVSELIESLEKEAKEHLHTQGEPFQNSLSNLFSVLMLMRYGRSSPDSGNRDLFSKLRNVVRVSCFSTKANSVVMWSHYANQHTGICVEFSGSSMLSSAKFLELVHPVRYAEKLFDFTQLFSPSIPDLDKTFSPPALEANADYGPILAACHKSKDWEYEKEWRLVSADPDHRKDPEFSLNDCGIKPSQIILGTKIDKADRAAIEETADKISVPVVNARLAEDRFEIKF